MTRAAEHFLERLPARLQADIRHANERDPGPAVGAHGAGAAGPLVFVGDGRSDFCVSGQMDILFAKGKLLDYARSRAIAELVDLIAHEPEPDGFFGVGRAAYRTYQAAVSRLIAALEADT